MALVSVLACDLCRTQPADTWQLTQADKPEFTIDLCGPCSELLRALRRSGRVATGQTRRRVGLTKSITYQPASE